MATVQAAWFKPASAVNVTWRPIDAIQIIPGSPSTLSTTMVLTLTQALLPVTFDAELSTFDSTILTFDRTA